MNKTLLALCLASLAGSIHAAPMTTPTPNPTPWRYTLEDSTGEVLVLRAGQGKMVRLNEGETVAEGDEIRVGPEGVAVLFLDEDTVIHLGSQSGLKIGKLQSSENGGFVNRLQLLAGRILSEVKSLSRTRSSFEVESGGVVCGVRGTAFEVEMVGEQVETSTYEGEVEVKAGDSIERVRAGYRYGFLKNRVLLKRKLDRSEKDRYEKWMKHRKALREKHLQRLKAAKTKARKTPIKRAGSKRERR